MAKRSQWYPRAEQLYVYQMMTLEGIAREIPVSTRTLQRWKAEGDWDAKQSEIKRTRRIARQEAEELYLMLVRSVKKQLESIPEDGIVLIDKAQADLIRGLHKGLLDAIKYEELTEAKTTKDTNSDAAGDAPAKKHTGLTLETLKRIEEELGL